MVAAAGGEELEEGVSSKSPHGRALLPPVPLHHRRRSSAPNRSPPAVRESLERITRQIEQEAGFGNYERMYQLALARLEKEMVTVLQVGVGEEGEKGEDLCLGS